jgi:SAM-dependent methyltransferase
MIAETSKPGDPGSAGALDGGHGAALASRTISRLAHLPHLARWLRARQSGPAFPAPPQSEPYDSWLQTFWGRELERIDAACTGAGPEALALFRELDGDLWAALLTQEYEAYPGIKRLLPDAPAPALQATWNGASGSALAAQSLAFYEKLRHLYARHSGSALEESRVLDFGCGWGRLTRFFARDVAPGALFGCDPVDPILDLCRHSGVPAVLAHCDFVPARIPFEERFHLAYAFSVFTHLSEPSHRASLRALHASLVPGGLLVLTIRPPQYLRRSELLHPLYESLGPRPELALEEPLYLFAPHEAQPLGAEAPDGEVTYGETVITPAYIREHWTELFELVAIELLIGDPHQVVLAMRQREQPRA